MHWPDLYLNEGDTVTNINKETIIREFASLNRKAFFGFRFHHIKNNLVELNNTIELQKKFDWKNLPILDDPELYVCISLCDVNERRIRDAESIGFVMRNIDPRIAVEIGTSTGHTTALMAVNAPDSHIFTVNISPEEINSGEGGVFTTIALERERIGSYYREKNIKNITQILANTANWEPDIGNIDVAFIDGCHDSDFVYNDTRKILRHMKPGSYILWHDFNVKLAKKYNWIHSVCTGIEWLYQEKIIDGPIFQIRDSWVGIYRV